MRLVFIEPLHILSVFLAFMAHLLGLWQRKARDLATAAIRYPQVTELIMPASNTTHEEFADEFKYYLPHCT